jgi:hypothetical protein
MNSKIEQLHNSKFQKGLMTNIFWQLTGIIVQQVMVNLQVVCCGLLSMTMQHVSALSNQRCISIGIQIDL